MIIWIYFCVLVESFLLFRRFIGCGFRWHVPKIKNSRIPTVKWNPCIRRWRIWWWERHYW